MAWYALFAHAHNLVNMLYDVTFGYESLAFVIQVIYNVLDWLESYFSSSSALILSILLLASTDGGYQALLWEVWPGNEA